MLRHALFLTLLSAGIFLTGCGKPALYVQGTLTMDNKPLANAPVLLVPDSTGSTALKNLRDGFKEELKTREAKQVSLRKAYDSLDLVRVSVKGKSEEATKEMSALLQTMEAQKKEDLNYKKGYAAFAVAQVVRYAVARVTTDAKGAYKVEQTELGGKKEDLKAGKYLLISAYDSKMQSGLLVRPVSLEKSTEANLDQQSLDPDFTITDTDIKD